MKHKIPHSYTTPPFGLDRAVVVRVQGMGELQLNAEIIETKVEGHPNGRGGDQAEGQGQKQPFFHAEPPGIWMAHQL
jgi:hypothetical protein